MALVVNLACMAQDIIQKSDGSTIKAIVKEISDSEIKYNRFDNPDGPLYIIPTSSILSITYKNGYVEKFGTQSAATSTVEPQTVQQQSSQSEANSSSAQSAYHGPLVLNQNQTRLSDAELLRIYGAEDFGNNNYKSPAYYTKKAKALRTTAWIGGGVMAGTGLITSLCLMYPAVWGVVFAPMTALGAIWTGCFLAGANHQMKKAKEAYYYSATMVEGEVLNFGKSNLTAGVNVLGNSMTYDRALGLGLTYNF